MSNDAAKPDAPASKELTVQQPAQAPAKPRLAAVPAQQQEAAIISASEPGPARMRSRHWGLLLSLLFLVIIPGALGVGYLYTRAADQHHAVVGFSVHSEELNNPLDILGSFTQSGKTAASDADILYEFIRSQQIVEEIREELDLVAIYNKPEEDFLFTLGPDPTIEDLHWYWLWMVSVTYDSGTKIIEIEVRAFDPEDANAVANAILKRSTALINTLSQEAREDAIRFAKKDLADAEARLRDVRRKLRAFRDVEQKVDPTADFTQRMGLLTALEEQLAVALVERDVLESRVDNDNPRLLALSDRIDALNRRIATEKAKLGAGGGGDDAEAKRLADVVGVYEELVMDREFAQQAYLAVLASYEEARAEARRKHRYLAIHVGPTRSEEAIFPRRWLLAPAYVAILFVLWAVIVLIAINLRDRR